MITKTAIDLIKEAAKSEEFKNIEESKKEEKEQLEEPKEIEGEKLEESGDVTDTIDAELKSKYAECIKDMPIIPKEIVAYKAEMVPVFKNESSYFVEMDNVVKYMSAWGVKDVKEAMETIAEANELPLSQLSLVIETKDYMSSVMESAVQLANLGDKSLLEDCELAVKLINMLKQDGINVVLTH